MTETLYQYMPHGMCYLWDPSMLAWSVATDAIFAISYLVIALMLLRISKKMDRDWFLYLLGAFILLCGASHAAAIWTVWHPHYHGQNAIKTAGALVSAIAALMIALRYQRLSANFSTLSEVFEPHARPRKTDAQRKPRDDRDDD